MAGKDTLACQVAGYLKDNWDDYELLILPVIPEPPWAESLVSWARLNRCEVIESGDYNDIDCDVKLLISSGYDKIFSPSFLDRIDLAINIHFSPLPKYRGLRPINWALKNKEKQHGVTIHKIGAGVDDGPIISQVKFSMWFLGDEVRQIYELCQKYAWLLFTHTMKNLSKAPLYPQERRLSSKYMRGDIPNLGDRKGWTREESDKLPWSKKQGC